MGGQAAKSEEYRPINDLECLGRCACQGIKPGAKERAAFKRFNAHEAPLLSADALREAVAALEARSFAEWPKLPPEAGAEGAAVAPGAAGRLRGALLGAAAADACGLATEFLSRARAEEFYGKGFAYRPGCEVFPDTHRAFFPPGDWTDDTDQMVLILWSLLRTGGEPNPADFAGLLKHWAHNGIPELGDRCGSGLGKTVGKVVDSAGFEENPSACAEKVWRANGCNLAANGAVMRAATCGFPHFWDSARVEHTAIELCRVTHFDSRCVASCVCVAVAIAALLRGVGPKEAAEQAIALAEKHIEGEHAEDFRWYVSPERTLDDLKLDDPHSIGYTFKALASGLVALRSPGPFEEIIRDVVSRGGDADTNAVVCGALLGCARGAEAVPAEWVQAMPNVSWLEAFAGHAVRASGL